jgi:hypothetical protein
LAGFPIHLLKNNKRKSIIYTALLISIVIYFNARFFRPAYYIDINDRQKFSGKNWQYQVTASIFDYLPIYAATPPSDPAPDKPIILSGNSTITDYQKGTNWQKGQILTTSPKSTIQLPLFYYPGFKLWLNDQPKSITYDNQLGLITFEIDEGDNNFEVKMTKTPPRLIGDLLTILGIILILIIYV